MAESFKYGNGVWATKEGSSLAYNDENDNYKPLPFSVTRDSIATRVNKEGLIEVVGRDKLRIDYTDSTKGVALLEPARTNLVTYSEELTQWTTGGTPTVTAVNNALTGQTNAYTIEDDNSSGYERVERNATTTAAAHTLSVFIKKKTSAVSAYSGIQMDSSNKYIIFDSYNGTFNTATGNDYTEISVDDYGSYWRLKATATTSSGSTRVGLWGAISVNGTSISTSATGSETFYGVQVELGSYATSYIPTSGSTVPRAADVANGAGNSEVFNDSEGVLFADIAQDNDSFNTISISDGGISDRVTIAYTSDSIRAILVYNWNVVEITPSGFKKGLYHKVAIKYTASNLSLHINGFEIDTEAKGAFADALRTLEFAQGNGSNNFYGKAKRIGYFDAVLTDAELEALTSYTSFTNMANELNLTIK